MKKTLFLMAAISIFSISFAATSPSLVKEPVLRADQIFIPIGKTGKTISLMELSTIKMKDLQELTGRKMKFADKMSFKMAQNKLRNNIENDGTINNKKLQKLVKQKQRGGETGFHFGGFALGFFLGLIGVLIAYLINDDYKRNRVKWSWIGLAVVVAINLILILAVL